MIALLRLLLYIALSLFYVFPFLLVVLWQRCLFILLLWRHFWLLFCRKASSVVFLVFFPMIWNLLCFVCYICFVACCCWFIGVALFVAQCSVVVIIIWWRCCRYYYILLRCCFLFFIFACCFLAPLPVIIRLQHYFCCVFHYFIPLIWNLLHCVRYIHFVACSRCFYLPDVLFISTYAMYYVVWDIVRSCCCF